MMLACHRFYSLHWPKTQAVCLKDQWVYTYTRTHSHICVCVCVFECVHLCMCVYHNCEMPRVSSTNLGSYKV